MVTIITDKDQKAYFEKLTAGIGFPFILVHLEKADKNGRRSTFSGLDDVLKLPESYEPVVMLAFSEEALLAKDPRWRVVMARPNVVFARLPLHPSDLLVILDKVGTRPADPLAIALYAADKTVSALGVLKHNARNINHYTEEMIENFIRGARQIFGEGTLEELLRKVNKAHVQNIKNSQFVGKSFPDICVDVEGTLLDNEGNLRNDIVEFVKQESVSRPVTIWTGGETLELSQKFRDHGIAWKIASKHVLRGAHVAMVVDDMEEEKFRETYGITFDQYHKV